MENQIILRNYIMSNIGLRKVEKEERYDDLMKFVKEHKKITMEVLDNDLVLCKYYIKED